MKKIKKEVDDEDVRYKLVDLLKRLDIKSADATSVSRALQILMRALQGNVGTPDKMYMDLSSYRALSSALGKPNIQLTEEDDET
jgi:hypothetical protein